MSKKYDKIVIVPGGAFIPGIDAIVTDSRFLDRAQDPTPEPLDVKIGSGRGLVAPWGDNNMLPQDLARLAECNTVVPRVIEFQMAMLYGLGLFAYHEETDPDTGDMMIKPVEDDKFEAFKEANDLEAYILQASSDFYWFKNYFPEMILSKDKKTVTTLNALEGSYCRYESIPENEFRIKNVIYSGKWPSVDTTVAVPTFDPKKPDSKTKFVYRMKWPAPSRPYYALPTWWGAIKWIEIANMIPDLKKAMMKNSVAIRYHIRIPADYWELTNDGWLEMTPEQQKVIKEEKYDQLRKFLTDPNNQGAAFVSEYGETKLSPGKEFNKWEIEVIGDKMGGEGKYTVDTASANIEIFNAMGIDPALPGMSFGGTIGTNNGGSNKREAYEIYIALIKPHQDFLLKPLYFIKKYNGWDKKLKFGFRKVILTTLDKNPTGVKKTAM